MTFEELGLQSEMAARLANNGITTPSNIQEEVFPIIRSGESVIALSKTGTGKTLAYLAPLVQRYAYDLADENPQKKTWALVLVPTRELAAQAENNLRLLTNEELKAVVIVGGESEKNQISGSEKAAIYVATPGRFLDLLKRKLVNTDSLKCVVFDEADRILDMGFINDVRYIRRMLPEKLQLCFFSATIHFGIDEMSYEFGVNAHRIGKEADELTVEGLDHRVAFVGDQEKLHALCHFLKERIGQRGIVFTNFKDDAHQLARRLNGLGLRAESLTSQLSQAERSKTMQLFRDNKVPVLIASDLASRGLDVENLDFVVNIDLPEDSATYLHRVGRTARAGKKGMALSLVGFHDTFHYERLQKFLGKDILKYEFQTNQLSGALPRFSDEVIQAKATPNNSFEKKPFNRPQQGQGNRPHSQNNNQQQRRPDYQQRPQRENHPPRNNNSSNFRPNNNHQQQRNAPQKNSQPARAPYENKIVAKSPQSITQKIVAGIKKLFGVKSAAPATSTAQTSNRPQNNPYKKPYHKKRPYQQGQQRYNKGPYKGPRSDKK